MVPLVTALAMIMVLSPYLTIVANAVLPSIPSSIEVAVGYGDTENRSRIVTACANCFPSPLVRLLRSAVHRFIEKL